TNAGEATITVTGNGNYAGASGNKTFTISKAALSGVTIADIASQTYTGTAIKPAVTVTFNGNAVAADQYTVSYTNNTNVGTAQVTLTAAESGNFSGTATKNFTITAKDLSGATIADIASQTYTGAPITPTLTVTLDGKELTAGTDYTVSYTNNTNVGTASATITGKGNYTGTASKTFTIAAATISASAEDVVVTYDGDAYGIEVSVTTPEEGYTIMYGTTAGTYTAEESPTLTDVGTTTVYYKVSADNYTDFTGSATITITPAEGTITFAEKEYTVKEGTDFTAPTPTTTPEGLTLKYTSSNTDVATVSETTGDVTVKGPGETTIMATSANANYAATGSYKLTVIEAKGYKIWINDGTNSIQITELNEKDVLGDKDEENDKAQSVYYSSKVNMLILTNAADFSIESARTDSLNIFLVGNSSLKRITGNNSCPLFVTTDGSYPGSLELGCEKTEKVVEGFSEVKLDSLQGLRVTKGAFDEDSVTVGAVLKPITDEKLYNIPDGDLSYYENEALKNAEPGTIAYLNKVIDEILYTYPLVNDNGVDSSDGSLVLNNQMTMNELLTLLGMTPTTNEYAKIMKGLTFMLPPGEGTIEIKAARYSENVDLDIVIYSGNKIIQLSDLNLKVIGLNDKIGNDDVIRLKYKWNGIGTVLLMPVSKGESASARKRIGRKTPASVGIYSIKVKPSKVCSSNPVTGYGEEYPTNTLPDEGKSIENDPPGENTIVIGEDDDPTGIVEVRNDSETDKVYDLQGRSVDNLQKAGVYIQDGKKIVVK
nr:Ig-like domain-containing protein [Prevotella sp.]